MTEEYVIATVQPIGILDEASLDPANMSSGSATLGQVPSADGAGGITWSDEIGPVPSGRQIINGTGITGGGDLTADRTLSVVQSALDPANMSSGGATLGQVPSADGVGGISWSDEIGPVPSGRQIINGTGITGGGDLSADRTLSVVQSALDPANMSSGAATSGQVPIASGGGAIAWADAAGVLLYATESALLAASDPDSTIAYAQDTDRFFFRKNGSWVARGKFISTDLVSASGTGVNSERFGYISAASGTNSLAVGNDAHADADYSVSIGANSNCITGANYGIAIGQGTAARSLRAIAIGAQTNIYEPDTIAIGYNASIPDPALGDSQYAIAIGYAATVGTIAIGADAGIAIGQQAFVNAGATDGIAIGRASQSGAASGIAIGPQATATATGAISIGYDTDAGEPNSIAIGYSTTISTGGTNSVMIGANRAHSYANCVSVGILSLVNGADSVSIGEDTTVYGQSVVIGHDCTTYIESVAIGQSGLVDQNYCVGVGQNVTCRASSGVAIGHDAAVADSGNEAIAVGRLSKAYDTGSIAIGYTAYTNANSEYGIAIGHASTHTNVVDSVTIGRATTATHANAVAIGRAAATTAANRCTIGTIGGSYDKELQVGLGVGLWGGTPPASQSAKVNDPTGGTTVDSEARTAINAIIDVLEAYGLSSAT